MLQRLRLSVALAAFAALSACSGGSTALPPPAAPVAPAAPVSVPAGVAKVPVSFVIQLPPAGNEKYISPATKSVAVFAGQLGISNFPFVNSGNCTAGVCTVNTELAPGAYGIIISLYDGLNAQGNVLSRNNVTYAMIQPTGANAIPIVLYGQVASAQVVAGTASFTAGTRATTTLAISLKDASGAAIAGVYPFQKYTFTLSDTSGSFSVLPATLTATEVANGKTATLTYTGGTAAAGNISVGATISFPVATSPSVTPAVVNVTGTAPAFTNTIATGVTTLQQSGNAFLGLVASGVSTATLALYSRADVIITGGLGTAVTIPSGSFTVATNTGAAPFALREPVEMPHPTVEIDRSIPLENDVVPDPPLAPHVAAAISRGPKAISTPPPIGTQAVIQVSPAGGTPYTTPMTVMATSAHAIFWVDNTVLSQWTPAIGTNLTQQFEAAYTSDVANFGSPVFSTSSKGIAATYTCDANGNPVQGVLANNINTDVDPTIINVVVAGGNPGWAGLQEPGQMVPQSVANCSRYTSLGGPRISVAANQIFRTDLWSTYAQGLFAHEVSHLIRYVNHVIVQGGDNDNSFINEGFAQVASDLTTAGGLSPEGISRGRTYLQAPQNYSLTAWAGTENGTTATGCTGCYGSAYLFARYLTDRFGSAITSATIQTPYGSGTNIANATNVSYNQLLSDFSTMLAISNTAVAGNDPRYSMRAFTLRGTTTPVTGFSYTLNGPATVSLNAGQSQSFTNAYLGAETYFTLQANSAVKVTDNTNGSFNFYGVLAQQ